VIPKRHEAGFALYLQRLVIIFVLWILTARNLISGQNIVRLNLLPASLERDAHIPGRQVTMAPRYSVLATIVSDFRIVNWCLFLFVWKQACLLLNSSLFVTNEQSIYKNQLGVIR